MLRKHSYLKFVNTGILSLLLLWSISNGISSADEVQPGEAGERPVIDARTDILLKAMGDYLKSSQQFSFHISNLYTCSVTSKLLKFGATDRNRTSCPIKFDFYHYIHPLL